MKLALEKVRTDGGTQQRAFTDVPTIEAYREAMEDGEVFPPIDLFFDGTEYWLADGFHRFMAMHEAGWKTIHPPPNIHKGTLREAILFAAGANSKHGKPRTNADKRRCVEMLLKDKEWKDRADLWICQVTRVSKRIVKEVRDEMGVQKGAKTFGRNGKVYDTKKLRENTGPKKAREARQKRLAAEKAAEFVPVTPPPSGEEFHAVYEVVVPQVDRLRADDLVRLRNHVTGLLQMMGAA